MYQINLFLAATKQRVRKFTIIRFSTAKLQFFFRAKFLQEESNADSPPPNDENLKSQKSVENPVNAAPAQEKLKKEIAILQNEALILRKRKSLRALTDSESDELKKRKKAYKKKKRI